MVCTAGQGLCQHVIGLLYIISHYQLLGLKSVLPIISKTSKPQVRQLNSELTKPFNRRNSRDMVTSRLPLRGSLAVYKIIYNYFNGRFLPRPGTFQSCSKGQKSRRERFIRVQEEEEGHGSKKYCVPAFQTASLLPEPTKNFNSHISRT